MVWLYFCPYTQFDKQFEHHNINETPTYFYLVFSYLGIAHNLLDPNMYAQTYIFLPNNHGQWMLHLTEHDYFSYNFALGVSTLLLAYMLDLLVHVPIRFFF